MKRSRRTAAALSLLMITAFVAGCAGKGASGTGAGSGGSDAGRPDIAVDDCYGTTYEIFVYSYADGNGDGIGDLTGIYDSLDRLNDGDPSKGEDLGVNALWLTPVFPSPTYHKYDATDYMSIDPDFGTLEDFDRLLAGCHERGIKLYLDLAVNHTSVEHPWFREEADYRLGRGSEPYDPDSDRAKHSLYNFSSEPMDGYAELPGSGGAWYYEARFWSGMPDLNLSEERVRERISEVAKFWLDRGVDGFRLDAVTSYYTDDHESSEEFLTWFSGMVREYKPDAYLVGEAWENQEAYARFYSTGADSFFDFAFSGAEGVISQVVKGTKGADQFTVRMAEEEELYGSYSESFINAPFYTNHDMARSAGYYGKDTENRLKLAYALNLLQTGNAFVYYGEELGMSGSGRDENKRAPFPWGSGTDGKLVCAGPPDMESFETARFGDLSEQMKSDTSVYSYCRDAIHLRARHPVIARGRTEKADIGTDDRNLTAFTRRMTAGGGNESFEGSDEVLTIVINTGAEAKEISLAGSGDMKLAEWLTTDGSKADHRNGVLTLPGYGIAVLKEKN